MNNQSTIDTGGEIVSEACAWIAQLESGEMSASDMAALREWMGRSPAHTREIRKIADISGQLSVLTELATAIDATAGAGHHLRKRSNGLRLAAPVFAGAFTFVIVCGIAIFALLVNVNPTPKIYKTAVGEYQTIVLADGTSVSLNTASQIEVDFNDAERRVRLVSGEALFEVASNPKRPFVVYSDTAIAEAIGTSFVVRLREAVTELAVVEGIVAFSNLPLTVAETSKRTANDIAVDERSHADDPVERVIVKAGHALTSNELSTFTATEAPSSIAVLSERDLQRKLSWTDGFLEFSETPLEEVVEELTRHNDVSVEIADSALKQLKFGGIFRTGDVDQLLGALEGLGVVVEKQGDKAYQLHLADAG